MIQKFFIYIYISMRSLNYLINTCTLIAAPMIISEKVETTHILTNERVNITQQSKQVNHSNTHNKSLNSALYYYSLEKGMATHSSILAWRIPQREETGRLQSMDLQRVGHDWVTNTFTLSGEEYIPKDFISMIPFYNILNT